MQFSYFANLSICQMHNTKYALLQACRAYNPLAISPLFLVLCNLYLLSAVLDACAHLVRPSLDLDSFSWASFGDTCYRWSCDGGGLRAEAGEVSGFAALVCGSGINAVPLW